MSTRSHKPIVREGSGNVFADLGLADSDELLPKARLASTISDLIDEQGLTQLQAASLLDTTQPKISNLVNGRLEGFSLERLARFLTLLGRDVEIVVTPRPRSRKAARILVSVA
jgi:predicted XRE-type DNA-binding protein